jgi:hypothetical protein
MIDQSRESTAYSTKYLIYFACFSHFSTRTVPKINITSPRIIKKRSATSALDFDIEDEDATETDAEY